ncbi:kinase-like protein [Ascodesmis nigricans]|uniref:Kinase-like protein n=1 Tax=Ascodesmis nigricans TaxID=341454 RepID=A0A4S2MXF9_9PEZI|nr:kinase-like protein [Ascodesmis nigricans]
MTNTPLGQTSASTLPLTDRFEIIKEVGDGSFGSVALAKVRSAGTNVGKRGSMVAIKTMKKTFDSFAPCEELREVIFLRQLPMHPHLVPALDIFLDPFSKKLHIAMEYMDGNLYQLMKAREGKLLELSVVKSILYQILSGLEHIHANGFFHRDIKPENILVSTTSHNLIEGGFRRYSSMMTPPSTPMAYSVKIADFGLAREISAKMPYTSYVSTRWYRAPEVLLRAGQYNAPVDIWAMGAMAVEVATLKPLFPGGNEVDQIWRICEVMGCPGQWVGRNGRPLGGGEWREGTRLSERLGFSLPRMTPIPMESILPTPTWPASLAHFVTWCLMWDPKNRPTSRQCMDHEFFRDAVDPLMPRAVTPSRMNSKRSGELTVKITRDTVVDLQPTLEKKNSWFRKSFIGRAEGVLSPPPTNNPEKDVKRAEKRSTWHAPKPQQGLSPSGAPIMILPSIKPVSPLSDTVSVQAAKGVSTEKEKVVKKIGRQLSVASAKSQKDSGYNDALQQTVDKLNGNVPGAMISPSIHKESFFSHLRKRARRLSGRAGGFPQSPNDDDLEGNAGCVPWGGAKESSSTRSSMLMDTSTDSGNIDRAIRDVEGALDDVSPSTTAPSMRRNISFPPTPNASRGGEATVSSASQGQVFPRTRRSCRNTRQRYETPDEHDELADEVLAAAKGYGSRQTSNSYDVPQRHNSQRNGMGCYATPSPQASKFFSVKGIEIHGTQPQDNLQQPTPPSEGDSGWGLTGYTTTIISGGGRR